MNPCGDCRVTVRPDEQARCVTVQLECAVCGRFTCGPFHVSHLVTVGPQLTALADQWAGPEVQETTSGG